VKVRIRIFGSLRDRLDQSEMALEVTSGSTVADVWAQVIGGKEVPQEVLGAINMEYASFEQRVSDGDEVAFFPPVTGG
jgi:molybdopterin synthase sulfur carrier subunit